MIKDFTTQDAFDYFYKHDDMDIRRKGLHSSDTVVTRSLIKECLGVDLSLAETYKLMYEEGMAPAKDYGIPQWYIDKHMTPLHVKKRKAEIKASGKKTDVMWKPWRQYKEFRDGKDV